MTKIGLFLCIVLFGFSPIYQSSVKVLPSQEDVYTSPLVLSDGIVFVGASGTVSNWPEKKIIWDSGYKLRLHPKVIDLDELIIFPGVFSPEVAAFTSEGKKVWSFRVPGIPSSPARMGENLITHSNKGFLTLTNKKGEILQQDFVGVKSQIFHSYPVVIDENKVLIYGSDMEEGRGSMVLWDMGKRSELWVLKYEDSFISPPAFNEDTLIIKSGDSSGRIVLIEMDTGMIISKVGFAGSNDLRFTSAANKGDFFYLSLNSTVVKIGKNGEVVWEFSGEGIFTSPVVWGDYLVLGSRNTASESGNGVGFFNLDTGDLVYWHELENGINADPIISNESCIVVGRDGLAHFFKLED